MIIKYFLCVCLWTTTSGKNVVNVKLCVNCDSKAYIGVKTVPNLMNYYLKTPTTTQDPVIDLCETITCSNGGTCVDDMCLCAPGFFSNMCENPVDLCTGVTCQNDGTCIMGTCNCAARLTGTVCEMLEFVCDSTPCMNDGQCQSFNRIWSCACKTGFTGVDCSISPG